MTKEETSTYSTACLDDTPMKPVMSLGGTWDDGQKRSSQYKYVPMTIVMNKCAAIHSLQQLGNLMGGAEVWNLLLDLDRIM